jgi:hypothetical protein
MLLQPVFAVQPCRGHASYHLPPTRPKAEPYEPMGTHTSVLIAKFVSLHGTLGTNFAI